MSDTNNTEQQISQANQQVVRLYQQGQYREAVDLAIQVREFAQEKLREDHPLVATSLNNLAELYRAMGNYAQAEPLYRQATEILRTALGEDHPDFATSLNNLALLYSSMGNYAQAEPLYRQATEIRRTALGEDHPDFATSLNNLAGLYDSMGNYAQAEPLYRQATEIYRTTLGEDHSDFATSLNGLAALYSSMGNYAQAEPLYRQATEIYRTALGEDHPDFATSLNNLAELYRAMGNYAQAEPLFRQATEIRRTVLGEDHPSFATSLNNLAGLYDSMGNYAQAEPLFRQATEIRRTTLGDNHPDFATSLNNLAALYAACEQSDEALALMQLANESHNRLISQIFTIGSDTQRLDFLKTIEGSLDGFLSLVSGHLSHSREAIQAALALILRRKNVLAEAQAAQRDALLGGAYPHLESHVKEWSALRSQIAQKSLAGPGPEGLEAHQQLIAEWNQQCERLEAELTQQIPEMNLENRLHAADRRAVALALPESVSLVEFVRFHVFNFKAVPARGEREWEPARYLAFVLPAGKPDEVTMIDLGEAAPIDQMIETFREGVSQPPEDRPDRNIVPRRREPLPEDDKAGRALRAAIFDPLTDALGSHRRLVLSPDGNLARLPVGILPTEDGRLLTDHYQIEYVNTGRDVLRWDAESTGEPQEPFVLCDPDFDFCHGEQKADGAAERRGRISRDFSRDHYHFGRLPRTQEEGEAIAQMLNVHPIRDVHALEGRFRKECASPRILHIATHGFFLEDQQRDPNEDHLGRQSLQGRFQGPLPENPLLRSGLALAGANTWLQGGHLPEEAEDGILTAEDVTGMNLLATELVVLSACETGLGEVRNGQGVYGLQRSFILAGAKTLVMSLWSVPDQQTRELMENFYGRILKGEGRAEALRQAQMDLRQKYPDPYFWGAFVCLGNPGPMSFTEAQ